MNTLNPRCLRSLSNFLPWKNHDWWSDFRTAKFSFCYGRNSGNQWPRSEWLQVTNRSVARNTMTYHPGRRFIARFFRTSPFFPDVFLETVDGCQEVGDPVSKVSVLPAGTRVRYVYLILESYNVVLPRTLVDEVWE